MRKSDPPFAGWRWAPLLNLIASGYLAAYGVIGWRP